MKRFRRSLSVRIFRKYILTSVIFSVSMAVFLVISKVFLSRYIWYEDSMMYQLFHWIDRNALFTIIFVSVVGWIIIFFYYWLRTFRYLERLIYATEELYESEDLIHLPDELKEVENMYRALGGIMKENPTWSTYLITSMEYFESLFGRKADRKRKLFNGRIKTDYYQFEGPRPPKDL